MPFQREVGKMKSDFCLCDLFTPIGTIFLSSYGVLVRVTIAVTKHHNQAFEEERIYSVYTSKP